MSEIRADIGPSENQVNAFLGRVRKRKIDRTRRSWSDREEEILVVALKGLSASGWKSDNGFRAGYLGKLKAALKRYCPNSDIKANPHIVSKITAWKKSYNSLQLILTRSGVRYNTDGDCKIDCTEEQWSQIVRADPEARFMRNKSWPYWPHWQVIFGKNRASGVVAEDLREAEIEYDGGASAGTQSPPSANLEDISASGVGCGTEEQVADNTSLTQGGGTPTGKKRKAVGGSSSMGKSDTHIDDLIQLLTKLHDDTNERLQVLSRRIGYEFDLSKARKEVYEMLGKLSALSKAQKFNAGELILRKVDRLDFFLGIPEEDREDYVLHALQHFDHN